MEQFRSVFPFAELPAELRNLVYVYALGDLSLADFFDNYYKRLLVAREKPKPWVYHNRSAGRLLAPPNKKTPNVFLINKTILNEASSLFFNSREGLNFNHGMLDFARINEFISPKVLQHVTAINITDAGHNEIIQLHKPGVTQALPCSWNGYIRLLTEMGAGLSASGHRLKVLTIDFSRDKRLGEHMNECWDAAHTCGFRDQMRDALDNFRGVRGVECVTLLGINPVHAKVLKKRMESKPIQFSDLPKEARKLIYKYSLGWEDISGTVMRAVTDWPDKRKKRFPYPVLTTPTVLLLNKEYSAEAQAVLDQSKKVLRFDLPADHSISKHADMPKLSRFIGRATLKSVQTIKINMESREWSMSMDRDFISALRSRDSKLQKFKLTFRDALKFFQYPMYPDVDIHSHLKRLTTIRGLEKADFSGDLPICYTDPLGAIMASRNRTGLPKLKGIQYGVVVDMEDTHRVDK